MRSTDDYLEKIPPLNANKPNFRATIAATVSPFADTQTFFAALAGKFDLDVAVGVQLDVVGQWVGISRLIPVEVQKAWLSLDYIGRGLNEAPWKVASIVRSELRKLDDDTYRRLIRAKIAANYADGTVADAQAALSTFYLAPTTVFVLDISEAIVLRGHSWISLDRSGLGLDGPAIWYQFTPPPETHGDMRWQIGVVGTLPDLIGLQILSQRLIPVTPIGVHVDFEVATVADTPLMGLDLNSAYVGGLNTGCWGASPQYVAENII